MTGGTTDTVCLHTYIHTYIRRHARTHTHTPVTAISNSHSLCSCRQVNTADVCTLCSCYLRNDTIFMSDFMKSFDRLSAKWIELPTDEMFPADRVLRSPALPHIPCSLPRQSTY